MRTNIEIDDELMAEAQALSGAKTKRETVQEALRLLVQIRRQAEILRLENRFQWIGDLDDMRTDRREK
ncbi:MAG: type II toxin-antitoxin system VapB family antitoxin [Rhodovibrio sp.]|nr:type II toxin-antitoxin system VapB family antitoxin [Rhodovibrio sp.]